MPTHHVDTSDLARAPAPGPTHHARDADEDEIIRLPPIDESPMHEPVPSQALMHAMTAPTPSAPVEDKARRANVLCKLRKYRASFDAVRAMKFDESWSVERLEEHLEDVRIMVSNKTTGVIFKNVYLGGVRALEVATCAASMKTYGLTQLCAQNAEINSILTELQCEIGLGRVPPGPRLALATIGACLALDSAQRKAAVLGDFKKAELNPEIANKFGDL